MKMLVKMLNWYLAFGGGRVIVAMFVDVCKYVKMPAIRSRKLSQIDQIMFPAAEREEGVKMEKTS